MKRKVSEVLAAERELQRLRKSRVSENRQHKLLIEQVEQLEAEIGAFKQLGDFYTTHSITPALRGSQSEATAVIVASDWHYEERVPAETTNQLNTFNLKIADARINKFWQNSLRLWQVLSKDIRIPQMIVALLGDFITGNIHDCLLEVCQLRPMEAIIAVQERIASGINFLLAKTPCTLVIPCHAGNHSRITQKLRHTTEKENSLEWLMYYNLANQFKGNSRVKFVISGGYHSYLEVYEMTLRFHHGHAIRYVGGVGGVSIPALRKIGQWANLPTHADIDVAGHHHTFADFGKLILNGCLIGYTPYALAGAFPYQKPSQAFFLLDKKRGKSVVAPIFLE